LAHDKAAESEGMLPVKQNDHRDIVAHYEACLQKHGDSHLGVDWPNRQDAQTRYRVMLEVIRETAPSPVTLLDFGCGLSHLYEYMQANGPDHVAYSGLDLSEKFVAASRNKFPANTYYCLDILDEAANLPEFDYIAMNGVFTEKRELSFDAMFEYCRQVIVRVFGLARRGIAFNVMSKHVEWEREDLFHLPFDVLAAFLCKNVTRNFVFRNDYGLYEYTTYVYK
jgi:SAM-dependent methyltransferase